MLTKLKKLVPNQKVVSFQQSDSGSGSAASSVSPIPPAQPPKPLRKRRPAPKPPVQQKKPQQSETIICHSRTSSDSSGYHEASVLSESPDSNNSSLPDSLPRRSKLPTVEPNNNKVESKLSRSLSNLHQASTSAAVSTGMKPAQSTSCLVPSRKKKPAPAPPVSIAEEKEEKSATLPPCARLLETPPEQPSKDTVASPAPRLPRSTDDQVLVTQQRTKPRAPVPRPRSTAFETLTPSPNVFLKLEGIFKKMSPEGAESTNTESESARLEAEIERMFEQATREHVSLESGVELSRGPSPDWNWEYRLPAPPTFRDDVTAPSLAEIKVLPAANSKPILFEPLESTEEVVKEESAVNVELPIVNNVSETDCKIKEVTLKIENKELPNDKIHLTPSKNKNIVDSNNKEVHSEVIRLNGFSETNTENPHNNVVKKSEKIYITPVMDCIVTDSVDNAIKETKEIIDINSSNETEISDVNSNKVKQNITIKNQRNKDIVTNSVISSNISDVKTDKVCISIKNEEQHDINKNTGRAKVERSDTVIRVNGRQERTQEQSAILNELTTVITERQTKPKEVRPEPIERQTLPLKNFCIRTYTSSKPVEIYKETPKKEIKKEQNGIVRRNSSAEEKKGSFVVKRSASVVTNLQRRLDLSRSNSNLIEVDESPVNNLRKSNLRKTSSELSINIDPSEEKESLSKKETGLQSLQVLRTILPQLSASQGALNTLGQINEKKEEKPAVCLTTWGERPKRQVSIKTDRDYVTSGAKLETPAAVTIEVVSPTRVIPPAEAMVDRRPRTSVYKSIETGNTKAIKLPASDLGRIPIVRSVELKKTPTAPPVENGFLNGDKPFGHVKLISRHESRQIRPPSYLFGCEPTVPPPPPAPLAPPFVKQLKPVSQREIKKASLDPREELLHSIRTFGKSSLKKVSAR
uniref:Unkown protein n=1 Tax=Riptortus pedestris TaxID=329032 RepID=R4WDM3_RIPPE|nr:unkown protein [Riptortus pedestris]